MSINSVRWADKLNNAQLTAFIDTTTSKNKIYNAYIYIPLSMKPFVLLNQSASIANRGGSKQVTARTTVL